MLYKKGDKIAFLNEPLKGVVINCIDDSRVLVETKGIEMDVSVNEIINNHQNELAANLIEKN